MTPEVTPFFHEPSSSWSYVVRAEGDDRCIVIDPVLDFDAARMASATRSADRIVDHVESHRLTVTWILETHAHADRLSAAPYLQKRLGGEIAIGSKIGDVQETWNKILNLEGAARFAPGAFALRLDDGETLDAAGLEIRVMHTPGHTPADSTYVIGDAAFIGDSMFMPDYGTARADFPGGDARTLYLSIRRILALPEDTRLFLCHDYLVEGRSEHACETTVAAQKAGNVHVHDGIGEDAFVQMREARDATLSMPALLLVAVPVNLNAGNPPAPEDNGTSYLKIPYNRF